MRCLLCYTNIMYVPNLNTKERKCLYYKTYGKMALEKMWI
jgi:hypothetical protein